MATKILVVEDSPVVRQTIRTALEVDGYEVTESGDAEQALALLRAAAPELVITDIYMSGMDGLGLIRAIRALPVFRFLPILVVTTETDDEMKQRGRAAGATGWIVKPFQSEQLRQVVGRLVRPTGVPA
jgi:two-component system, chemotaxis family, chemotaxis protein CheY